jgi:hypothetical protein
MSNEKKREKEKKMMGDYSDGIKKRRKVLDD